MKTNKEHIVTLIKVLGEGLTCLVYDFEFMLPSFNIQIIQLTEDRKTNSTKFRMSYDPLRTLSNEVTYSNEHEGRFPANIILDEIAGELLDEQSGIVNQGHWPKGSTKGFGDFGGGENKYEGVGPKDKTKSGASRFFYQAKVSNKERNMGLDGFEEKSNKFGNQKNGNDIGNKSVNDRFTTNPKKNNHPTVKPINLMAYLCRLITPTNGIVLDPFMGSGSTGIACMLEGFKFVGMEMDMDYFRIAQKRIESFEEYRKFVKS